MLTFNVMTNHSVVDQIRKGGLTSFSNQNYRHIFEYVSPDDYIKWNVRGTHDDVWTQIDSVSRIYKSNLLFRESVHVQGCLKRKYPSDNIVVYFHTV